VIAMYAGAVYVLLEVVDIITPALLLPSWTVTLVIVLLAVGFPITIILSWIFDITPEGIQKTESVEELTEEEPPLSSARRRVKISDVIIAVLFVVVCVLLYPKIFKKDQFAEIRDEEGRISIAVMPFKNMSGDSSYNNWQDNFQHLIISNLSNTDELAVHQYETMLEILGSTGHLNYASITPSVAKDIALKLKSGTLINGSYSKAGAVFRITIQLVESESSEIYKSFAVECNKEDEFFHMADSLSNLLKDFLKIEIMKREDLFGMQSIISTTSPEAFYYLRQGLKMYVNLRWKDGIDLLSKAVEIDPEFTLGYCWLSTGYQHYGDMQNAGTMIELAEENREKMSMRDQLLLDHFKYGYLHKDPKKGIQYAYQLHENDPQNRFLLNNIGDLNRLMHNYDKEIEAYEQYIELDDKWGPMETWIAPYVELGEAYHIKGNHKREEELYLRALEILPDSRFVFYRQAVCALSLDNDQEAVEYISRYRKSRESDGKFESEIDLEVGEMYNDAGRIEMAIEIISEVVEKNPNYLWAKYYLGKILIENDVDLEEGMKHIEAGIQINPGSWFLYAKGMGLFKLDRPEEALELLEKSWELRSEYDHDHYLLLQQIKQALTSQNN